MQLTRRTLVAERMDDPDAPLEELAEALAFIRTVNRRLGGARAAIGHLQRWSARWPRGQVIRVLDLGTGSADIPLAMVRWAERAGWRLHVVAVDRHPGTLAVARLHVGDRSDIELVQADAGDLMDRFEPRSFDYVHAGMFLHHLSDVQVLTTLTIMDRLRRRGLIWNDLIRGVAGRIGIAVLTLGSPEMVRHDARVSVAAGFTRRETLDLATRAGLERPQFHRHLLYRFTLVSEKEGTKARRHGGTKGRH
jgi:hypothetical protein